MMKNTYHHDVADGGAFFLDIVLDGYRRYVMPTRGNDELFEPASINASQEVATCVLGMEKQGKS